jgi:hypothetical protein
VTVARVRYAAAAAATGVVTLGVLSAYPLYVQFFGPYRVEHSIHATDYYVNDLVNVVAPAHQYVGGTLAESLTGAWTGGPAEWNGYLGLPLIAVLLALLAARRRAAVVRFAALMIVLTLVLSFGSRLHVDGAGVGPPLPWAALAKAPLLHQVLPARFGLYADLFAAMVLAVAADIAWRSRRLVVSVAGGLAVGAVVGSWLPSGWPTTTVRQPAFFQAGGGVREIPAGSLAVVLPLVTGPNSEHAELWQARAGFRFTMPEGYLIVPGPHMGPRTATFDAFGARETTGNLPDWQARAVRAEWRDWGVRTVVVGPGRYDPRLAAREVQQVLGSPPRWEGDVAVFAVRD